MAIKILTDSGSDINQLEAEQMGVFLLPMIISFGDTEFFDGVNLLATDFYDKLEKCNELPVTSQINPFRYDEAFEQLTKNGDKVIAITLSSKISGTHRSALVASEKFKGSVFVVDSLNACIGQRLLVQYALKLVAENLEAEEIVEKLELAKLKIRLFAMIDTLKFLKKGGRISSTQATIGGFVNLKPMISVVNGEVKIIGKTIGFKKAIQFLNKEVLSSGINFEMPHGVLWSGNSSKNLDAFLADSAERLGIKNNISRFCLGGTIGTHIGSGAVGIAFFEK